MAFLETPRFPGKPSFGYSSGPMYAVDVTTMRSGREKRNRTWSRPLFRFTVTVGPRAEADIESIAAFFHAVGGKECGFRFKDYADFKSCALSATPACTDQPLVSVSGSDTVFQLTKRYTYGARSQDRDIYKPVSGTVLVGVDGVLTSSGFTVDYTAGTVTFDVSQAGNTLTWGGQFDVPVRFDNDELPVTIQDKKIHSVVFGLVELRL